MLKSEDCVFTQWVGWGGVGCEPSLLCSPSPLVFMEIDTEEGVGLTQRSEQTIGYLGWRQSLAPKSSSSVEVRMGEGELSAPFIPGVQGSMPPCPPFCSLHWNH